jgi:hypothetical protein
MSVQAISWVLEHSESAGAARHVLISIANHADQFGQNSYPGMRRIAREGNLRSLHSVVDGIAQVEDLGELLVYENAMPVRGGRAHRYEMPLVPGWEPPPDGVEPRKRSTDRDTSPDPKRRDNRDTYQRKVSRSDAESVAIHARKRRAERDKTVNRQVNPRRHAVPSGAACRRREA